MKIFETCRENDWKYGKNVKNLGKKMSKILGKNVKNVGKNA